MLPLLRQVPAGGWMTKQPLIMLARCGMGAITMICYIMAYRTLPLADVNAPLLADTSG